MTITSGNIFTKILLLVLLIILNQIQLIQNEPTVVPLSKSQSFVLDLFDVNFDEFHVKFFRKITPDSNIYEFEVIQEVPKFFIDVYLKSSAKDRDVYKLTNLDGCVFLSTPVMNRLFHSFYKRLLVNKTLFSCPIKVGNFFLRNEFSKNVMPAIHPKGNFTLNVKLKNSTKSSDFLLDFIWSYRIGKMKH